MINSIQIKNFQSHKDTVIEFHKGINAITGTSDVGKSSIYRALNWLRLNRPIGNAFVRNGSKGPTKVILDIDGTEVIRTKSKTINSYQLGNEQFNVVKTDVPEEITQFLNLDDISVQGQHDSYFLLQDTAGEVAKKLNKIAGFEIIDTVMKDVKSAITKNSNDITYTKEHISELEESIDKYEHLDSVEIVLNEIVGMLDNYENKSELISELENIIGIIASTEDEITDIKEWLEIENIVEPILNDAETLDGKQNELQHLNNLISDISELENTVKSLSDKSEYEKDVERIGSIIQKYIGHLQALESLVDVIKKISQYSSLINGFDNDIKQYEEELNILVEKNKICPLCGVSLTDDRVEHIKHSV